MGMNLLLDMEKRVNGPLLSNCLVKFLYLFYVASMPGSKLDVMEELDASSSEDNGIISTHLNQIKRWFLSHSQYLNFFTILVLASVSFDSLLNFKHHFIIEQVSFFVLY